MPDDCRFNCYSRHLNYVGMIYVTWTQYFGGGGEWNPRLALQDKSLGVILTQSWRVSNVPAAKIW